MEATWKDRLRGLVSRNRPSYKPQLWEDLPLAVRRRLKLELLQRGRADWLDTPRVVDLSRVGTDDGGPPSRMSLVLRDAIGRAMFLYGTYEICSTRLIQAFLRPGMTFADVGANIGYYTVLAGRAVGESGTVYSFEPNAALLPRLEENVRLNDLFGRVRILPQAVTRKSGEIRFYRSTASDNSGLSSTLPGDCRSDQGEVVPCVSLDDFAAKLAVGRRIDLIKIDVEGAELDVLEGGHETLERPDAPAIVFESMDVATVGAVLDPLGYSMRRIHYTITSGLELIEPGAPFHGIFDAYEPPNYFAAKDPALFGQIVERANARHSAALRMLGRW